MSEFRRLDCGMSTYIYKCPYEGSNCRGNKHCHILETTDKLKSKLGVIVKCPMRHGEKIFVEIGA